jgi:hypothetical protein
MLLRIVLMPQLLDTIREEIASFASLGEEENQTLSSWMYKILETLPQSESKILWNFEALCK